MTNVPTIRKVIVPAAGYGTRFLPATKASPKEMLPIVDKPVIQYIVEEAVQSGIDEVIIITGYSKRAIEDHFDYNFELEYRLKESGKLKYYEEIRRISDMARFVYVRQKAPLGNGHAVLCAREVVGNEPFAVAWGDDLVDSDVPCMKQMLEVFEKYQGPVIATMRVPQEHISDYGIIAGEQIEDKVWRISSIVEKPEAASAPSNIAAVKGYILTPDIFDVLENQQPGKGGEIWLTDAINILAQKRPVYAYEFDGHRFDVGDKLGFLKATVHFALKNGVFCDEFRTYLGDILSGREA
jgi:UTP--glucose-1-phosphate uridylyltransferase